MTEDKAVLKAIRRVWTMAALVLLVFAPCTALIFAAVIGWNPLCVVPAIGAAAALEYGLWTYQDWGRKATQIMGAVILAFIGYLFSRNPTTYKALDWLFTPFNLMIIFSAVYCIAAGFSKGVMEIFRTEGAVADIAVRNGRKTFMLKRGLIILIGYALWTSACRGAHRLADQAVSESQGERAK